jgi:hypothetical protein
MFITGLFLHEMDRPSAPSAPAPGAAADRNVAFLPAASSADVGASLQVNF